MNVFGINGRYGLSAKEPVQVSACPKSKSQGTGLARRVESNLDAQEEAVMVTSSSVFLSSVCMFCIVAVTSCSLPTKGERGSSVGLDRPQPPYFGQQTPGTTPVLFAPGAVSTDAIELNAVFTPDGREFFFTRIVDGVFTMYRSVFGASGWSAPSPLMVFPNGDKATAVDMAVSPDGTALYFLGEYPHEHATGKPGFDIWVSRRVNGELTTAQVVPPPVSTAASEVYPVVVADGSLYFSSNRPGSLGGGDVYRAQRLPDGRFAEPVNLGPPISGDSQDGDTFVAPDESYMILTSRRAGTLGQADLYVSFRKKDGAWTEPVNLGPTINTDTIEYCPMVTPDGKYLFFSRRIGATWETTTGGDVYWVDAKIIEQFRP